MIVPRRNQGTSRRSSNQHARHRSRYPFTDYIINGARAVSNALNNLSAALTSETSENHATRHVRDITSGTELLPAASFAQHDAVDGVVTEVQNHQPTQESQVESQSAPSTASGSHISHDQQVIRPVARRSRAGRAITSHATSASSRTNSPQTSNARPATRPRHAPLRRQGAFHEHLMPIDSPARQLVTGRDPATLYENLFWDAHWGTIPTLADVSGDTTVRPSADQVLSYLNNRFRLNRYAYHAALEVLFPPEGPERPGLPVISREPVFARVVNTTVWRQDADWEGGIVPVEREWGPSQADDAADSEAEPYDPDCEDSEEGHMSDLTDEELLAISRHVAECLALRQITAEPISARPSASISGQRSSSSSTTLEHGATSVRQNPKRQKRVNLLVPSRAKASALRSGKRTKSQEWLRAKIRQSLKKKAASPMSPDSFRARHTKQLRNRKKRPCCEDDEDRDSPRSSKKSRRS